MLSPTSVCEKTNIDLHRKCKNQFYLTPLCLKIRINLLKLCWSATFQPDEGIKRVETSCRGVQLLFYDWILVFGNETRLTGRVSDALIVLWLLYYLLNCRYLAPLNSLKWSIDSKNRPEEQMLRGIRGSDCTATTPPSLHAYNGGSERKMDVHTKDLERCQTCKCARSSFKCSCWNVTSQRALSHLSGTHQKLPKWKERLIRVLIHTIKSFH